MSMIFFGETVFLVITGILGQKQSASLLLLIWEDNIFTQCGIYSTIIEHELDGVTPLIVFLFHYTIRYGVDILSDCGIS
jgi:hypothetical protein